MKLLSTKDDILHFALQEFSQKSYDEASLNAILKNSGISKGSFYYHFKDKKDLYVSLLRSAMKAKWDYIQSNTPQQGSIDDSIFQLFREQARVGAEFGNLYPITIVSDECFYEKKVIRYIVRYPYFLVVILNELSPG